VSGPKRGPAALGIRPKAFVASRLTAIRRHNATMGEWLAVAGSVVVVLAGGYWFVQRVFLPG